MYSDEELRRIARALIAPCDSEAIAGARRVIENGMGSSLLPVLMDEERDGHDDSETTTRTMSLLDSLATTDFLVAGYLMAKLYPIASRLYSYHVCETIELWIDDRRSPELSTLLRREAGSLDDPQMRIRYEQWARVGDIPISGE